ncbi:hypothetical protein SPI_01129 [Niveomyces insectorum RCEF 264]|uniref:Uncharacterized protein n=1 Tax=Niveomyces insectorum RCEF 264 TaxID=1081102 RepID=A0A167YPU4_9HYPO|nr:hypothetical protein SPI_01129 [Niveomyces insectorum RCEF 264]
MDQPEHIADVPLAMAFDRTYSAEAPFVADLLDFPDRAFRAIPNAVTAPTTPRASWPRAAFLRSGAHRVYAPSASLSPAAGRTLVLKLSDEITGNLFVDGERNVTGIIQLEWIVAVPATMLQAPIWLARADAAIDDLAAEYKNAIAPTRGDTGRDTVARTEGSARNVDTLAPAETCKVPNTAEKAKSDAALEEDYAAIWSRHRLCTQPSRTAIHGTRDAVTDRHKKTIRIPTPFLG